MFLYRIPARKVFRFYPGGHESDMSKEEQEMREENMEEMRVEIRKQTQNEFTQTLKGKNSDEAVSDLREERDRLCEKAEALANQIDRLFEASGSENGLEHDNILDATRNFYFNSLLPYRLTEADSETDIAEHFGLLDEAATAQWWKLEPDTSSRAYLAATNSDHPLYEDLAPLAESRRRPCSNFSEATGWNCGLDSFPLDVTMNQMESFIRLYLPEMEVLADRLGNSHALLCFRIQTLETVLNAHDLYGEVTFWSEEEARNEEVRTQPPTDTGASVGRPGKVEEGHDTSERDPLINERLGKSCAFWVLDDNSEPVKPDFEALLDSAKKEAPHLFRDDFKPHSLRIHIRRSEQIDVEEKRQKLLKELNETS